MGAKQSQESAGPVATAQQNSNSGRSHHQHHQHRLHHSQHPLTLSHPGLVGHSSRPSSSPASVSREHHRHHSPSPQPHLSHSQRPQALSHPSPALSHPSSAHSHPHRVTSGSMLTTSYSHPSAHSQAPRSHVHVRREGERDRERRAHQPQRPDFMALDFTMPSLDQRLVPVPRSAHNIGSSSHSRGERRRRGHRLNDFHVGAISSSAPVGSLLIVRGLSRVKCPLCSKEIASTELEEHFVTCMSRPRVMYNEDTLTQEAGECSICLEDMMSGDKIARLPCLCVYHIKCLQQWYTVSQTCPEHPESDYKS